MDCKWRHHDLLEIYSCPIYMWCEATGIWNNPPLRGQGNVTKYTYMDPSYKFHNVLDIYPTMRHFVTEMCTHVHIYVTKECIVGYGTGALWDLCNRSHVAAGLFYLSWTTTSFLRPHTEAVIYRSLIVWQASLEVPAMAEKWHAHKTRQHYLVKEMCTQVQISVTK